MISSEEGLRILLGWKAKNSLLYPQRCASDGKRAMLGMVVVLDANSEELTLAAPGRRYAFLLSGAEFNDVGGEKDSHVDKISSRQVLDIQLGDKSRITLMELWG